jgi:hypothetical protein
VVVQKLGELQRWIDVAGSRVRHHHFFRRKIEEEDD